MAKAPISEAAAAALNSLSAPIRQLGDSWAQSPHRPRPAAAALSSWDHLLEAWIDSDLPLILRIARYGRGACEVHASGRRLTFSDNTAAHWAFANALAGTAPTLEEVRRLFDTARMPLAFAIKQAEKPRVVFCRGGLSKELRLNVDGWKVCHIHRVSEGGVTHPCDRPMEDIVSHFRRFLSPRNMFLVPLALGGLGEAPEMIEAVAGYDRLS